MAASDCGPRSLDSRLRRPRGEWTLRLWAGIRAASSPAESKASTQREISKRFRTGSHGSDLVLCTARDRRLMMTREHALRVAEPRPCVRPAYSEELSFLYQKNVPPQSLAPQETGGTGPAETEDCGRRVPALTQAPCVHFSL
ncbi:hypothetical protein CB1_000022003 [Camelus ferus]|nr:hypothetical protein CB1_000022003 [Camelus ferus]